MTVSDIAFQPVTGSGRLTGILRCDACAWGAQVTADESLEVLLLLEQLYRAHAAERHADTTEAP